MKIKILTLFSLLFAFSITSFAQCVNGTKSYPLYKTGAKLVNDFDEEGSEIVRIEYDLVFSSKESFRNLTDDWEYTIIGFADDGVKDLDLKVYVYDDLLDKWSFVTKDASSDSYAVVVVKPEVSARYKVEVIVYEFEEGYTAARYGLLYVHD